MMDTRAQVILLEGPAGGSGELAQRLRTFEIDPIRAANLESARALVDSQHQEICVVMIPTDFQHDKLKKELKSLAKGSAHSEVILVSIGRHPTRGERKVLRAAGMRLALWEPYDDGTLRFQINRALSADREHHHRRSRRVPTYLLARIFVGGRTKDAVVYSLSEGGAFLETPRASMAGAVLDVEIRLASGEVCAKSEVLFSNVPGNLQQPNLPLGMGLKFTDISPEHSKRIKEFIAQRMTELDV